MTASPAEHAAARDWLYANTDLNLTDLTDALKAVYGDGASLGAASASQTLGLSVTDLGATHVTDWPAYWDAWTPGDPDAAALLNSGGLADLLDNADTTIDGIGGSLLNRLGNALADGAAAGESVDAIAASLHEIITDPARTYTIANTELNRAVTSASLQTYANNNVAAWDLITSPGACVLCEDTAADGPYQVDDVEDAPPIHPSCRCSVAPVTGPSDAG